MSTSSNNTSSSADVAAPPEDSTRNNETMAFAALAVATAANAKYKLMLPVKLSISRSTYLTIPLGLSSTSFLESLVLLSNMKVWSCSLSLSLMPHKKSKRMHSKPKPQT